MKIMFDETAMEHLSLTPMAALLWSGFLLVCLGAAYVIRLGRLARETEQRHAIADGQVAPPRRLLQCGGRFLDAVLGLANGVFVAGLLSVLWFSSSLAAISIAATLLAVVIVAYGLTVYTTAMVSGAALAAGSLVLLFGLT